MHLGASNWLAAHIGTPSRVLEFGSLNINGTARDYAPTAFWWGLDMQDGPGVDEVADAASWCPIESFAADTVVCAEVLEHTPNSLQIIANAYRHLKPGGRFLMTCASHGRQPHSAIDGGPLRDGEYYENITPAEYRNMAELAGFVITHSQYHADRGDLYALGIKPL
jgi:SAM-dependent methyltransferase